MDYSSFPGYDIIEAGIRDLAAGDRTQSALLVAIGAGRLRRSGLSIPDLRFDDPEHELYALLSREDTDSAHSRYNALIGRLVSFERALECAA